MYICENPIEATEATNVDNIATLLEQLDRDHPEIRQKLLRAPRYKPSVATLAAVDDPRLATTASVITVALDPAEDPDAPPSTHPSVELQFLILHSRPAGRIHYVLLDTEPELDPPVVA